jgi:uncharacterized protein YgfB (UPF0149 family)
MKFLKIFTLLFSNLFLFGLSADENASLAQEENEMISNLVIQEESEISLDDEEDEEEDDEEEEE